MKSRHIRHGPRSPPPVQALAALELIEWQATPGRGADLAQEGRDRRQVVHRDVAGDVDGVAAQQVAQEVHLHRLPLDVVEDRFLEVLGADPVVTRVVKPGGAGQLVGQCGLAHAGHAEEGDRPTGPGQELFGGLEAWRAVYRPALRVRRAGGAGPGPRCLAGDFHPSGNGVAGRRGSGSSSA